MAKFYYDPNTGYEFRRYHNPRVGFVAYLNNVPMFTRKKLKDAKAEAAIWKQEGKDSHYRIVV